MNWVLYYFDEFEFENDHKVHQTLSVGHLSKYARRVQHR